MEKKIYSIPKVSKKQSRKNNKVAKLKAALPSVCAICGREYSRTLLDAAHLLPKSIYPEYATEDWIIVLLCRGLGTRNCHKKFDDDLEFRKKQTHLIEIVKQHDELAANRYFDL